MAAASGSLSELDCPICLDGFDSSVHTPRFMPCHHTLCHSCLNDLIDHRQNQGAIKCPMCQRLALVPQEKAFGFQVNFYLERQLQPVTIATRNAGSFDRRRRTSDGERSIEARPQNIRKVTSMIEFSSPQRVDDTCRQYRNESWKTSIGSVRRERGQQQIYLAAACSRHPRENIVLYCRQCRRGICIICKMTTHEYHKSDDLTDVANAIRRQLRVDITAAHGKQTQISDNIKTLKDQKRNYECKISTIREDVSRGRQASIQALSDKSARLTTCLDELQENQAKSLDDEITCLTNCLIKLKADTSYLNNILETAIDTEVVDVDRSTVDLTKIPLPSKTPANNCSPILLSSSPDLFSDQTDAPILNINTIPEKLFYREIPGKVLSAADNGVLAVTAVDIRQISSDGSTTWTVKASNVIDIVSSVTGIVYVLLHQRDMWLVKKLEIGSFLSDFLELASNVDCITSGPESSVVLGRSRDGRITLTHYNQDGKWTRKVEVPCRYEKLDRMMYLGRDSIALLYHTSAWATEVMILNSGGQILQTFSGCQGQGCNVRDMASFCGGLVVADSDAGTILLLNSKCNIVSQLMDRQSVRILQGGKLEDVCVVERVTVDRGGILWLLSRCGSNTSLHAVRVFSD